MANISKIKPMGASGEEYDVKDATARTEIGNLNKELTNLSDVSGYGKVYEYTEQYLNSATATANKYYAPESIPNNKNTDSAIYTYAPIPIVKGRKYWYSNLYNYFCWFYYDDGTYQEFTTTASDRSAGFITATKNGYALISTTDTTNNIFATDVINYPSSSGVKSFNKKANLTSNSLWRKEVTLQAVNSGETYSLPNVSKCTKTLKITNGSGSVGYVRFTFKLNGSDVYTIPLTMDANYNQTFDFSEYTCDSVLVENINSRVNMSVIFTYVSDDSKQLVDIAEGNYIYKEFQFPRASANPFTITLPVFNGKRYLDVTKNNAIDSYFEIVTYKNNTVVNTQTIRTINNGTKTVEIEAEIDKIQLKNIQNNSAMFGTIRYIDFRQRIYYVGSSREFTTITDAVNEATKYTNSIIYIDAGTYDLVNEFGSNLDGSGTFYGLLLKNGVQLIFSSDAKVTFNYTGSNEWVLEHVSPFNCGEGGFTIENLNLECSNCRYCVHDERVQYTERYTSRYKNCYMYIDNHENTVWVGANQCIGGGLGTNGEVIIEDCIFENPYAQTGAALVSYHNTTASDGKSRIVFKGNYCKGTGTFSITKAGTSEKISEAIIHDNCLGSTPYIVSADRTIRTDGNVTMLDWNNVIRT